MFILKNLLDQLSWLTVLKEWLVNIFVYIISQPNIGASIAGKEKEKELKIKVPRKWKLSFSKLKKYSAKHHRVLSINQN